MVLEMKWISTWFMKWIVTPLSKIPRSAPVATTKMTLMEGGTIFLFCFTIFYVFMTGTAVDTIAANQTIRDGDTIVSAGGSFELGFFSPGTSTNRYLGIWYKKISTGTVVWVANRKIPLNDTSGILRINPEGILVLFNGSNSIIWSSNSSRSIRNPVAQLLDTGDLVVKDEKDDDPENYIWQSFDYPTHIFLPGMKLGKDLISGLERNITSWRSTNDPYPGEWSVNMDINGYPQIVRKRDSAVEARLGPWNGLRFTGMPSLKPNLIYTFKFVFNQREIFYEYELINSSVVTMMILNPEGSFQRLNWIDRTQGWFLYSTPGADNCARYALCGAYGSCNINNSPSCSCLRRFKPRSPEEWSVADWSSGCLRRTPLECGSGDGFQKYTNMKLPDTKNSWFNESISLKECEIVCLSNCSCSAYSNMNISGSGSGCFLWFGDLIDLREYPADGQEIYIRIATSELNKERSSNVGRRVRVIVISVLLVLATLSGLCLFYVYRRKLMRKGNRGQASTQVHSIETQKKDLELPLFTLSSILQSTNSFSINHKLGEGGFGAVYKGKLGTGQEIAVKQLSKCSAQGLEEFRNEIVLISKLQHRNLVRILGCCLEGEERMLVYEYLPNKSLDYFIFDEDKRASLTWKHRFEIATGIAKGLLYLHHDSRLRIIHRDLKASNILLDAELNPKISDFGIARIFGGDQSEGRTKRVIGTYGYMSPEYAIHGKFSMKSDVFSFGVLLLEIVSGKKNTKYHHPDHYHSLLGHAWLLWSEGKALELVDVCLKDSIVGCQVLRFIQIGLLCTQQFPEDRPTISSVIFMLGSEEAVLPHPKYPGFFSEEKSSEADTSLGEVSSLTENALTITMMEPR